MNKIFFWSQSEFHWLSNFEKVDITLEGLVWPSVEHYYQAKKFLDPQIQEQIRTFSSPGKVKRFSRKNKDLIRPDWEEIKLQVMYRALVEKFKNLQLRDKLLATENKEIFEDSPNDLFWGTGELLGEGKGLNHLGKMLMEIRKKLILNEIEGN